MPAPSSSSSAAAAPAEPLADGSPQAPAPLVAPARFERGDVVFCCAPAAITQSGPSRSKTPACGFCGAPVGSLEAQLAVLAGRCAHIDVAAYEPGRGAGGESGPALPDVSLPASRGGGCLCTLGCGELYCDAQCEAAALDRGHRLLCVGPVDESHPLYRFKIHALECEEDSYLLAAQALAAACCATAGAGAGGACGSVEAALRPYGYDPTAAPGPWWEVAAEEGAAEPPANANASGTADGGDASDSDSDSDSDAEEERRAAAEEEREFRALLRAQVGESWALLARGVSDRLRSAASSSASAASFSPAAVAGALALLAPPEPTSGDESGGEDGSAGLVLYGRLVSLCALRGVDASAPSPAAMFAEALSLRRLRAARSSAVPALRRWAELIDDHEGALAAAAAAAEGGGSSSSDGGGGGGAESRDGDGDGDGGDESEEGAEEDGEGEYDLEEGFRARVGPEEAEAAELAERFAEAAPGFQGICLAPQVASVPHSCVPTCVLSFFPTAVDGAVPAGAPLRVHLRALVDLRPGDAVTRAWVDADASYPDRKAALRALGLPPCACALCQLQSNSSVDGFPGLGLKELREIAKALSDGGRPSDAEEAYEAILHLSGGGDGGGGGGCVDADAVHGVGLARVHQGRWTAGYRAWRRGAARIGAARGGGAAAGGGEGAREMREVVEKERVYAAGCPPGGAAAAVAAAAAQAALCATTWAAGCAGREVHVTGQPVLSARECSEAVTEAEAWAASNGGWSTARHYAVPTTDVPVHTLPGAARALCRAMRGSVSPLLQALFGVPAEQVRVHDAFLVKYSAAGGQRSLPVHSDQSHLSFVIALNAPPEFDGGGTLFEELADVGPIRPGAGCCCLFPGELMHCGEAVTAGTRYIIAGFLWVEASPRATLRWEERAGMGSDSEEEGGAPLLM